MSPLSKKGERRQMFLVEDTKAPACMEAAYKEHIVHKKIVLTIHFFFKNGLSQNRKEHVPLTYKKTLYQIKATTC